MDGLAGSQGQAEAARTLLARELRRLRKEARLTQAALARQLDYVREYVALAERHELPWV